MIAIPTLDLMHFRFVKCLTALTSHLVRRGVDFNVRIEGGTLVYMAREKLAADAINGGFTHMLWLDADMIFTPADFDRLAATGLPFVTGVYCSRRPPFRATLFDSLAPVHRCDAPADGTAEVLACGFGFVLTGVEVLHAVLRRSSKCFTPMDNLGEDISFCLRARDAGYRVCAHGGVRLGHIAHIAVWPEDQANLARLCDSKPRSET